jgi:hypothetical protein
VTTSSYSYRALLRELELSSLNLSKPSYPELVSRYGSYGAYLARIRGSLIRLFGEPLLSSSDIDEAFLYLIEASGSEGQTWKLAVYQASSGIVIGGDFEDFSNRSAAMNLRELLLVTDPDDFEIVLENSDSGKQVTYGCRNGACYWNE